MRLPRVRVTVRRMMALVLVLAVWLGWTAHRAHDQRDAIAALWRGGGQVHYHWQGRANPGGRPRAPKWLIDLVGPDVFGHVHVAWLRRLDNPPDWPTAFAAADRGHPRSPQELSAESPSQTDAMLPQVPRLVGLRRLDLGATDVTDSGLRHLEGLISLDTLYLDQTEATDAGPAHQIGR